MTLFYDGEKVKVDGIAEIGEIVGRYGNHYYIVMWDKPPFDTKSFQTNTYRATMYFSGMISKHYDLNEMTPCDKPYPEITFPPDHKADVDFLLTNQDIVNLKRG